MKYRFNRDKFVTQQDIVLYAFYKTNQLSQGEKNYTSIERQKGQQVVPEKVFVFSKYELVWHNPSLQHTLCGTVTQHSDTLQSIVETLITQCSSLRNPLTLAALKQWLKSKLCQISLSKKASLLNQARVNWISAQGQTRELQIQFCVTDNAQHAMQEIK